MSARLANWLELLAWAAAWGLTLLMLELIVHENVRQSANVQVLLAFAVGLILVILAPFVYSEMLGVRASRRARKGACGGCGYSLRGLEQAWARAAMACCPECGRRAG